MNGKYKKINLVGVVQETSKQIVDLFYTMKKTDTQPLEDDHIDSGPFLTANQHRNSQTLAENTE